MASASTFATLRALHAVIGDALDEIQRVYAYSELVSEHSTSHSSSQTSESQSSSPSLYPTTPISSPPSSPASARFPASDEPGFRFACHSKKTFSGSPLSPAFVMNEPSPPCCASYHCRISSSSTHPRTPSPPLPAVDFPSPYTPYDPSSLAEQLAVHPAVVAATGKIVSAAGQMSSIVQPPFFAVCDACMGYNLAACMRFLEHTHIVEILREAGPLGLHITDIAKRNGIDETRLAHVLRLLATHHILNEVSPDVFANTRVSSFIDTGKTVMDITQSPEQKYSNTNGIAAFVGMSTDELFKSAAYLSEAFAQPVNRPLVVPTRTKTVPSSTADTHAPSSTLDELCVRPHATRGNDDTERVSPAQRAFVPQLSSRTPSAIPTASRKSAPGVPNERTPLYVNQSQTLYSEGPLTAFNIAFATNAGFFEWLEEEQDERAERCGCNGVGVRFSLQGKSWNNEETTAEFNGQSDRKGRGDITASDIGDGDARKAITYRLDRFAKAMMATGGWEAPGAILNGFDWSSIPRGSIIVDVGGGIGSTTMVLAQAFGNLPEKTSQGLDYNGRGSRKDYNFKFIVQDRKVVVGLGVEAWRAQCPEMLDSGMVSFQEHDFFTSQPIKDAAVFLLRVVLHDWPDRAARKILRRLREAAVLGEYSSSDASNSLEDSSSTGQRKFSPGTKLIIADHVLPLACVDDFESMYTEDTAKAAGGGDIVSGSTEQKTQDLKGVLEHVKGPEHTLAPAPLLPNLGKANASAYYLDLTMQAMFNGKERTLREICALALSAGWRVVRVTRTEGSLFGHVVCVPTDLPDEDREEDDRDSSGNTDGSAADRDEKDGVRTPPASMHLNSSDHPPPVMKRISRMRRKLEETTSGSRCGTPTFGSRLHLPKLDEPANPVLRSISRIPQVIQRKSFLRISSGSANAGSNGVAAPPSPNATRPWTRMQNAIGSPGAGSGGGAHRESTKRTTGKLSTPPNSFPRRLTISQTDPTRRNCTSGHSSDAVGNANSTRVLPRRPSVASLLGQREQWR